MFNLIFTKLNIFVRNLITYCSNNKKNIYWSFVFLLNSFIILLLAFKPEWITCYDVNHPQYVLEAYEQTLKPYIPEFLCEYNYFSVIIVVVMLLMDIIFLIIPTSFVFLSLILGVIIRGVLKFYSKIYSGDWVIIENSFIKISRKIDENECLNIYKDVLNTEFKDVFFKKEPDFDKILPILKDAKGYEEVREKIVSHITELLNSSNGGWESTVSLISFEDAIHVIVFAGSAMFLYWLGNHITTTDPELVAAEAFVFFGTIYSYFKALKDVAIKKGFKEAAEEPSSESKELLPEPEELEPTTSVSTEIVDSGKSFVAESNAEIIGFVMEGLGILNSSGVYMILRVLIILKGALKNRGIHK